MPVRRLPLGVVLPIALLGLLVALATLQYRWIGTVSESERDVMRQSLDRRAGEFATEFDREIIRVYQAFHAEIDRIDPKAPDTLATRFDEWREGAPYPGLVERLYYVDQTPEGQTLLAYSPETRTFQPAEWSGAIERARRHVMSRLATRPGPPGFAATPVFSTLSLLPDVPALILPAGRRTPTAVELKLIEMQAQELVRERRKKETLAVGGVIEMVTTAAATATVIVVLSDEVIRDQMLPALVAKHFPDSERVRVAVLDQELRPILTRGEQAERLTTGPDAMASLFVLRPDLVQASAVNWTILPGQAATAMAIRTLPAVEANQYKMVVEGRGGGGGAGGSRASLRLAGWRVHLQHAAGSLDAAVAQVRARNLWLSFGILATLAASVGLIVFNARRSEKLAAQQMDFVATVSHELRTPLAVIRSAAQNLSAGVVHQADQAKRYGDLIESEGRRLTDMVEQVLEYAGLNGNRAARLVRVEHPGAVIREAVASCDPLCTSAGITVDMSVSPDLPPVLADEGALRRAIGNLVTNAIKYGSDGRWIGVTAQAAGTRGRQEIQIAVADRGRGIDPQDLPHVFEPFFRGRHAVERQIHGNGLGLSLVKRIAESHGGRVTATSTPGGGATFVLHLPAAPPETVAALGEMAPQS